MSLRAENIKSERDACILWLQEIAEAASDLRQYASHGASAVDVIVAMRRMRALMDSFTRFLSTGAPGVG